MHVVWRDHDDLVVRLGGVELKVRLSGSGAGGPEGLGGEEAGVGEEGGEADGYG